jgi:hypothetical protein
VRADQYKTFLANPDADGPSGADYDFERVVSTLPKAMAAPAKGGGSHALLIALVVVGSLVVAGGGLVVWAHS